MANLKYGDWNSDDVRQIQQQLKDLGYDIAVDGKFGAQTDAIVRQYQKDNGLMVDGIVGNQTRTSLNNNQQNTVQQQDYYSGGGGTSAAATPKPSYDPSTDAAYQSALAALQAVQGKTPIYADSYREQLDNLYQQIAGRDKFSYDLNADALYRQYADQYARMGDRAMQDTMGQTAALTGGYGSTYAQNAGQQAYQNYLAQLNDVVPTLEERAYGRYVDEGNGLINQYNLLGQRAEDEYSKYLNDLNQWQAEKNAAQDAADAAWQRAYQLHRDAVSDSQWERQFAASQAAKSGSGGGGSGSGGGGGDAPAQFNYTRDLAVDLAGKGASAEEIESKLRQDAAQGKISATDVSNIMNVVNDQIRGVALTQYYSNQKKKKTGGAVR